MKFIFVSALLFLPLLPFAQNGDFEILLYQNGKEVAIQQNECTLDKSPFQLIYKFVAPQHWVLIAGKSDSLEAAYLNGSSALQWMIEKADFGGADNYFNESRSIRAQEGERQTEILFVDEQHHAFDSIYQRDTWTYGVRTIDRLATRDNEYLVEEWPDSLLILATGRVTFEEENKQLSGVVGLRLYLRDVPPFAAIDVKGRTYLEEGEAEFQEGCEGCGNLGYFEFLKNGKDVKFLRSGSDIYGMARYEQIGDQVILEHAIKRFSVSADGKQLIDLDFNIKYLELLVEEEE
jgi:hypothetical protein